MVLQIGEVLLTSADSDFFPAYVLRTSFLVLFPTSNTRIAFYYFLISPDLCPSLYYFCHKFLNVFCFQVTLFSILQRQTLPPPLASSPCISQQKMPLSIVVIYSKQILVMASPFLEKWIKFLLKLLEVE